MILHHPEALRAVLCWFLRPSDLNEDQSEVVVKQEQPNSRSADTISFLDGGGGMTDVFQNISNVVESIGNALLENMRSE